MRYLIEIRFFHLLTIWTSDEKRSIIFFLCHFYSPCSQILLQSLEQNFHIINAQSAHLLSSKFPCLLDPNIEFFHNIEVQGGNAVSFPEVDQAS